MNPSAQKKTAASIGRLMDFCRIGQRLEANKPSFPRFLGLTAAEPGETPTSLCPELMSFRNSNNSSSNPQPPSLVFSYKFPDRCQYLPTLSTYASILDDATTLALVAATNNPIRPGVSVTMQCQRSPQPPHQSPPKEVDIWTTITKQGRTLGFVRAEMRDPSKNDALICSFDHVKYLPTSWIVGWMLSPIGMWCLNLFFKYLGPYVLKPKQQPPPQDYSKIMDSYEQTSESTATFAFGPQHSNGLGGLHGGVQAILMEKLGTTVAQNELRGKVMCERLSVSYQSSASKQLELQAHVMLPPTPDRVTLRIEIARKPKSTSGKPQKKVVVVSEGILTFVASSKKDQ